MIARKVAQDVVGALDRQAAVALLGPRQVGKTTLALEIGQERNALYLDLQRSEDRVRLEDPSAFLEHYEDRLVILDEIHRAPELFSQLRGIIDRGRRRGKRTGRFLLLGSASIDLLKQSSETLAGRIAFVELTPFLVPEIFTELQSVEQLWLRGGFPESFIAASDELSFAVRQDFNQTYLRRDVTEFAPRISTGALERLWHMLAHLHGGMVNASAIATNIGVSAQAITNYLDLLSELFLVRRLQPYHANLKKRLVKAPKIYLRDSGILHALLGVRSHYDLFGHSCFGASWEGFVIENLLALCGGRNAWFYRTSAGAEIDLLLDLPRHGRIAIEIKRNAAFKLERGFHHACEDLQPQKVFVVHGGQERFPLPGGGEALSLQAMCEEMLLML